MYILLVCPSVVHDLVPLSCTAEETQVNENVGLATAPSVHALEWGTTVHAHIVQCIDSACTCAQYRRSTHSIEQTSMMQPLQRMLQKKNKKKVGEGSRRKESTASAMGEFVLSIV